MNVSRIGNTITLYYHGYQKIITNIPTYFDSAIQFETYLVSHHPIILNDKKIVIYSIDKTISLIYELEKCPIYKKFSDLEGSIVLLM